MGMGINVAEREGSVNLKEVEKASLTVIASQPVGRQEGLPHNLFIAFVSTNIQ
jgi:hypothetical protein